jgi:integrase
MALTDTAVRQAKATGTAYTLGDIDGLSLAVSPHGGKSWHFRYYWMGRQKRMSFGTYPEVSLREARQARDEARALLGKNINPRVDRKQKRQAVRLVSENTFSSVFNAWIERHKQNIKTGKGSTHAVIMRIFNKDVLPSLGKQSILEIRRPDLLDVLARIEQRNAWWTAQRLRGFLNQMYRFALVKVPGLEYNYASDLDVVAPPRPPTRHHPHLRLDELPALLQTLREYAGHTQTRQGLRLLLLTGVRTGELRQATPDQFDLERGLWAIPPEQVKQLQRKLRKANNAETDILPYLVPLSRQAIEIVRELLKEVKPFQRYLLRHQRNSEESVSHSILNEALKRMGYARRLTGHGIRGTLSTALNEIDYPAAWIEAQLSHADPNHVRAAYNHAEYVEQRRHMMQDWADRLDLLERGDVDKARRSLTVHPVNLPENSPIPTIPEHPSQRWVSAVMAAY